MKNARIYLFVTAFLFLLALSAQCQGAANAATNTGRSLGIKDFDPQHVVYPEDGAYELVLTLSGLTNAPAALSLRVNEEKSLSLQPLSNPAIDTPILYADVSDNRTNASAELDVSKGRLKLRLSRSRYHGNVELAIGDGTVFSEPRKIALACYSAVRLRSITLVVALVLLMIPIVMIRFAGGKALHVRSDSGTKLQPSWISILFLDRETATYSLSKFQLYLWLAASVTSYLYLLLAQKLVQDSDTWLDIPKNLPMIFLFSAGTPVVALFVTNSRGPKGAGNETPSLADLVSSGGVAAADRFQFFVWTVLGCSYYLYLTLGFDPATIKGLPDIPERMVQLMGLSSAGYLAGKFARRAGPVIDDVVAAFDPPAAPAPPAAYSPKLILTLRGRVLSQAATFRIGDDDVTAACFSAPDYRPEIKEREDETKPDVTGKILILTIAKPKPEWITKGDHKLTISNPDGQNAIWTFKLL
jgi:hypothetical protein